MPKRSASPNPTPAHHHRLAMQLEPSLAPHAGLPGLDGTSRFCYGIVAAKDSGSSTTPGALAAAIRKAELAAAASATPAGAAAAAGASKGAASGGGLPVGPGVSAAALEAPAGTAQAPGAPGAPITGGDTSGVGGVAAGFHPATGAYAGTAVGEAKVMGTVAQ